MGNSWDLRYKTSEYIYGEKPNEFLKSFLDKSHIGHILLPGDGEGRNSVYAAKMGWEVTAFDSSIIAKEKAQLLAQKNNLKIAYYTNDVNSFTSNVKFDLISIIYLHLPPLVRSEFHKNLQLILKPNGTVLLECFSKEQLNFNSGGPKSLELLYSIDEIKEDFSDYKIDRIEKKEIQINEGSFHQGKASVIRLIAQKI